jgi:hypothetical protein
MWSVRDARTNVNPHSIENQETQPLQCLLLLFFDIFVISLSDCAGGGNKLSVMHRMAGRSITSFGGATLNARHPDHVREIVAQCSMRTAKKPGQITTAITATLGRLEWDCDAGTRFAGGISAVAAGASLCNPDITSFLNFFHAAIICWILYSLAGALYVAPVDVRARVADPVVITHVVALAMKINKFDVVGSGPLLPLMLVS